ncbi:MAG: hypothetical protein AAFZ67_08555 [Planctomycetota bacterium]
MTSTELDTDFAYCIEHDLLSDHLGRMVARNFALGLTDDLVAGTIRSRAVKHRRKALIDPQSPFKRWPLDGPHRLGVGAHDEVVGFQTKMVSSHVLRVAGSGAGKTFASCRMILEVAREMQGLWLFDLAKTEYSRLKEPLAERGVDLHSVAAHETRLNWFKAPDGVPQTYWNGIFGQGLSGTHDLYGPSSRFLISCLHRVAQQPSADHLLDCVETDKGSHPQVRQAVADALSPLMHSLGEALRFREGWSTEALSRMAIAFDLSGLPDHIQDTFIMAMLMSEFSRRVSASVSNVPQANLWVSIDEGARLCRRRPGRSDSALSLLTRIGRGVGITTSIDVQEAHDIDPGIIANSGVLMLGRTGSYSDAVRLGRTMGLSKDQFSCFQKQVKPGVFTARFLDGPSRQPIMVNVDPPQLGPASKPQGIPPELEALPVVRADVSPQASPNASGIDEASRRTLLAIRNNPMQPSSSYASLVGMGQRRFIVIRDDLVSRGLVQIHEVQKSRGRPSKLLAITNSGEQALSEDQ